MSLPNVQFKDLQQFSELVYLGGLGLDSAYFYRLSSYNLRPLKKIRQSFSTAADTNAFCWGQQKDGTSQRDAFSFNINLLLSYTRYYITDLSDVWSLLDIYTSYSAHMPSSEKYPRFNFNQSAVLVERYFSGKYFFAPCVGCGYDIVTNGTTYAHCPYCNNRSDDRPSKKISCFNRPTKAVIDYGQLPKSIEVNTLLFYLILNGFSSRLILEFYGNILSSADVKKAKLSVTEFLSSNADQNVHDIFYCRREGWYLPSRSSSSPSSILKTVQAQSSFNLLMLCAIFYLDGKETFDLIDSMYIYRMYIRLDRTCNGSHEIFSPNLACQFIKDFVRKRVSVVMCRCCAAPIALHKDAAYDPSCQICDEIYYPSSNVRSHKRYSLGGPVPSFALKQLHQPTKRPQAASM